MMTVTANAVSFAEMFSPPWASDRQLEEASTLCQVITAIHQRGWCDGTGGNFSRVVCKAPLELLMAPSGVDKGSLTPADLIVVNGESQVIHGEGKASAETLLHLAIITTTGAGAVLHTHSQSATLLSRLTTIREESPNVSHLYLQGLEMLKGLEGIHSHTQTIAIPILANNQNLQELSQAATPHLAEAPYGLLIAGHGLYAWGDSLFTARRHLEILEFLLEQHWRELLLNALLSQQPDGQ